MSNVFLMPIVIMVWLGFLGCMGVVLSASLVKSSVRKRMHEALTITDEDVDELTQEQRDEEMDKSFATRILSPLVKKMGRMSQARVRGAKGEQIRDMLDQAGHPLGMGFSEFMGLRIFMLCLLLGVGILSSFVAVPFILDNGVGPGTSSDPMLRLMFSALWVMIMAFVGFSGPTFWLRKIVNKRLKLIRKSMADVVDLIVLAIEAGLGFDMAVGQAVEKTSGPLTEELRRVLDEVRVGKPQGDAFRAMAMRIKMPELTLLVAAIDQAMKMGVGLGQALRLQATEIRERRMAIIKEAAGKLPVKMMLPLVLFIFPALFVVILGPAAVQMAEMSATGAF